MMLEPKVCTVCGSQWTPINRYQAARNKTCGRECMAKLIGSRNAEHAERAVPSIPCATCGAMVHRPPCHAARTKATYCSYSCRSKTFAERLAPYAGNMKGRAKTDVRRGADNPAWKGGVTLKRPKGNYKGVRYVRAPEWVLPMARKDGYIMEHRLVMARLCGRFLDRTEVVNHIDHNPSNNDPSNLELWPTNADHKRGEVGRFVEGVANRWFPRVLELL
jgi:hypothetical protein